MGTENGISGDLKAFLDYIGGRESDNDFVKKLEEEVKMAKQNLKEHDMSKVWFITGAENGQTADF